MKRCIWILLAIGLANVSLGASAEEILFERTVGVNRSVNIFDTDQFDLDLTLGDQFFTPTNPVTLFDDLLVTPDDVGNEFEVATGDAAFDMAAERLTDAENEFIRLILTENQSGGLTEQRGWSESNFFLGLATSTDPDLAGATVERIRLRIDDFTLAAAATGGPGGESISPPVNLQLTLSFYGTPVPEPAGIWLASVVVATLLGISGRRRA